MAIVSVRRQGGAAIMTIPAEIVKALGIDVGSKLEIGVSGDAMTARPAAKAARRRFTLRELLRGATPNVMKELHDETAWAREGGSVGREV
jgi:antitoxin ChpS